MLVQDQANSIVFNAYHNLCISIVTNFEVGHFLSTVVVVFFLYEIIMSYCERNQKKETNHAGI